MSDENDYDLKNIVLNLAVRVGQLEGTLKTFMETWVRQDGLAHEARNLARGQIDLLSKQVERVAVDVQNTQQDIAELKKEIDEQVMPTIELVDARRHRLAGAKSVWALIGAGVVALASAIAYIGDKVASYIIPKP